MQNVLGRIATTLVILYPVIAFSIPESAIQTASLKSGETEQDNADYTRSFDEGQEENRAWPDSQMTGLSKRGWQNLKTTWGKRTQDWQNLHSSWGKRAQDWQNLHSSWGKRAQDWQNLHSSWGKRAQDWQNLHSSWGKRQGWQKLHGGWGKRGWKDMQSSGWGKRFKEQPQFDDDSDKKYEHDYPTVPDKRSWNNFQGSWGKRAADWTSFRGSWGKRSPADYMNDYSGYGDDGNTYKASFYPPDYNSYSSYLPNYNTAESEN